MKVAQTRWTKKSGWEPALEQLGLGSAQLAFVFSGGEALSDPGRMNAVRKAFPEAYLFGCSTAGEICATGMRMRSAQSASM